MIRRKRKPYRGKDQWGERPTEVVREEHSEGGCPKLRPYSLKICDTVVTVIKKEGREALTLF